MAASGYTPILLYASGTATNVPLAANLTSSASGAELALNYADGKLFYKDSGGTVQVLATKGSAVVGGSNTQVQYNSSGALAGSANMTFDGTTLTAAGLSTGGSLTLSGGTANGVAYLNGSNVVTTGSVLTFDGVNMGIGTNSPAVRLDVHFAGTSTVQVKNTSSNQRARLEMQSGVVYIGGVDNTPVTFGTNYAEQMRLTSTGLGIGTSSPGQKLEVAGNVYLNTATPQLILNRSATTSASYAKFQTAGTNNWGIGQSIAASGTNLEFYNFATSSDAMVLDTSGNLGIGTSSPSYKLDVLNNTVRFGSAYVQGASGRIGMFLNNPADNSFALNRGSDNAEYMRFDGNGNLGIGTTSPGYKLDAIGTIRSRNASGDAGGLRFWSDVSGNGNIFEYYNASLIFGTNDTERMRLDSSGNLLVGKTATTGTTAGIVLLSDGTITSARAASTNSNTTLDVYSTGAAAYRFYVGMGGTVYATSTTISAISDIRFKENVRDLDAGLSEVMALKPRLYDWKEGKGANIKNARGFIAQEFETVFPDLIDEWNDPAPEGEEPYKSVRQDLIPVLVKAIQEQQVLIESLTKRLADAGIA